MSENAETHRIFYFVVMELHTKLEFKNSWQKLKLGGGLSGFLPVFKDFEDAVAVANSPENIRKISHVANYEEKNDE